MPRRRRPQWWVRRVDATLRASKHVIRGMRAPWMLAPPMAVLATRGCASCLYSMYEYYVLTHGPAGVEAGLTTGHAG